MIKDNLPYSLCVNPSKRLVPSIAAIACGVTKRTLYRIPKEIISQYFCVPVADIDISQLRSFSCRRILLQSSWVFQFAHAYIPCWFGFVDYSGFFLLVIWRFSSRSGKGHLSCIDNCRSTNRHAMHLSMPSWMGCNPHTTCLPDYFLAHQLGNDFSWANNLVINHYYNFITP